MKFKRLMNQVREALEKCPESREKRAQLHFIETMLVRISAKYTETPESPIELLVEEIDELVNIAISNHLLLEHDGKKEALLTTLISMGTWQNPAKSTKTLNQDAYLGLKDSRIECVIAEKAQKEASIRAELLRTGQLTPLKNSAVFGSSMNPPTMNHLAFIQHLIGEGYFVHIIPNAASPLKPVIQYAPQNDRYEMIKIALSETPGLSNDRYIVDTLEIDRDPPSRLFMTVSALILLSDPSEVFTLILTLDDNFEKFDTWYKWREFGTLCPIKFYTRPGITETIGQDRMAEKLKILLSYGMTISIACRTSEEAQSLQDSLGESAQNIHWTIEFLPTQAGSATQIRKQLMDGEKPQDLTPGVFDYIVEHHLYGFPAKPSLKRI